MRGRRMCVQPKLDPDVEDETPTSPNITVYDETHFVTCLRLLDVLHHGPASDETRTLRCLASHLARAQWMTKIGYRRILERAANSRKMTSANPRKFRSS